MDHEVIDIKKTVPQKLKQEAKASTKAIIYQLCVAVEKCFEMIQGQKVLIEELGDITKFSDLLANNNQQLETKHYSGNLTDNHINFWKTLYNWMQDGFKPEIYSSLILYTTQSFGNTKFAKWNHSSLAERRDILSSIYKKRQTNNNGEIRPESSIQKFQNFIFNPSQESKLNHVMSKLLIMANSPNIQQLYKEIQERHLKGFLPSKKNIVLDTLLGFVAQAGASQNEIWEISFEEFTKQVEMLNMQYGSGTKEFPKQYLLDMPALLEKDIEVYSTYLFVKKIHDIEYFEVVTDAINDYLGTCNTIHKEFQTYSVPPSRTEMYVKNLEQKHKARYRIKTRESRDFIQASQDFYDETTSENPLNFVGFDETPLSFRNGMLHISMDDEAKELKWKIESHDECS